MNDAQFGRIFLAGLLAPFLFPPHAMAEVDCATLPHWVDPANLKLPEPTALLPAVNKYSLAPDIDDVAEEFRKYNMLQ